MDFPSVQLGTARVVPIVNGTGISQHVLMIGSMNVIAVAKTVGEHINHVDIKRDAVESVTSVKRFHPRNVGAIESTGRLQKDGSTVRVG